MNLAQLDAVIRAWNRRNANGSMSWAAFRAAAEDLIDEDVPCLQVEPQASRASALDALKFTGQPRP